jgi:hypothetical protein
MRHLQHLPPLLLLLLAAPLAAAGTWSKIGSDSDAVLLLDKASVRSAGIGFKAATMQSYRKPQSTPDGKQYLSVKSLHLYNCDEGTMTLLAQDYYAGVLGRGEPVGTYKYESYDPEMPGTPLETAMQVVCKKKRASGKGG